MARYIDADCRICRRHGEKLFLKGTKCVTKCTFEKRPNPPGQAPTGGTERGRKTDSSKIVRGRMAKAARPPQWLAMDPAAMTGRVLALPNRADGDKTFNEGVIVEYYSR